MFVKPTGNHLLVSEELPQQIGGIFLTKKAKMDLMLGRPRVFRVLAKGPGKPNRKGVVIPIECEVGDRVICHSYTEGPQDILDDKHIITSDQILAVMPGRRGNANSH